MKYGSSRYSDSISERNEKKTDKVHRPGRRSFVRNVAILATGTAGAQAIALASSPILTRLYGPDAFGVLGIFMAVLAVVSPVAALSLPIAIVLPKEDLEAKSISRTSVILSIIIAAFSFLFLLFCGDWILNSLNLHGLKPFILFLPALIILSAWYQIAQQWNIRKKRFSFSARVAVFHAFIVNAFKIAVGWFMPVSAILIIMTIAGKVIYAGFLSIGMKIGKNDSKAYLPFWATLKKYYDFPLFRSSQNLINAVSQNLPIIMLTAYYGPVSAGYYTLCRKILSMPSQLIGSSVGDVFYPRISDAAHKGEELAPLILKATLVLAGLGFLPFFLIVLFGPSLFSSVFGDEWRIAGTYARWLSLWIYFMFLNNPSSKAIAVISAQGFHLIYTILTIAIRLGVLVIGFHVLQNEILTIAMFGSTGALINILLIGIILAKSRLFDERKDR